MAPNGRQETCLGEAGSAYHRIQGIEDEAIAVGSAARRAGWDIAVMVVVVAAALDPRRAGLLPRKSGGQFPSGGRNVVENPVNEAVPEKRVEVRDGEREAARARGRRAPKQPG
jgi:hypothetical protein